MTLSEADDDRTLMQRMAQRDEAALAVLYDRYGRLVFSVAYSVLHEREAAEEVTLDIFLRAWQHAAGYDPALAKVTTWLTRMARNLAIDRLRRRSVRPLHDSSAWSDSALAAAVNLPGTQLPEAAVELRLLQARVRAALAELPAAQREALALAYFHGLSQSEIAAALGQPLGTVKGRIRSALQRLRRRLGPPE